MAKKVKLKRDDQVVSDLPLDIQKDQVDLPSELRALSERMKKFQPLQQGQMSDPDFGTSQANPNPTMMDQAKNAASFMSNATDPTRQAIGSKLDDIIGGMKGPDEQRMMQIHNAMWAQQQGVNDPGMQQVMQSVTPQEMQQYQQWLQSQSQPGLGDKIMGGAQDLMNQAVDWANQHQIPGKIGAMQGRASQFMSDKFGDGNFDMNNLDVAPQMHGGDPLSQFDLGNRAGHTVQKAHDAKEDALSKYREWKKRLREAQ